MTRITPPEINPLPAAAEAVSRELAAVDAGLAAKLGGNIVTAVLDTETRMGLARETYAGLEAARDYSGDQIQSILAKDGPERIGIMRVEADEPGAEPGFIPVAVRLGVHADKHGIRTVERSIATLQQVDSPKEAAFSLTLKGAQPDSKPTVTYYAASEPVDASWHSAFPETGGFDAVAAEAAATVAAGKPTAEAIAEQEAAAAQAAAEARPAKVWGASFGAKADKLLPKRLDRDEPLSITAIRSDNPTVEEHANALIANVRNLSVSPKESLPELIDRMARPETIPVIEHIKENLHNYLWKNRGAWFNSGGMPRFGNFVEWVEKNTAPFQAAIAEDASRYATEQAEAKAHAEAERTANPGFELSLDTQAQAGLVEQRLAGLFENVDDLEQLVNQTVAYTAPPDGKGDFAWKKIGKK